VEKITLKELEDLAESAIRTLGNEQLADALSSHLNELVCILNKSVDTLQDCCNQYRARIKIMEDGIKEMHGNDNE